MKITFSVSANHQLLATFGIKRCKQHMSQIESRHSPLLRLPKEDGAADAPVMPSQAAQNNNSNNTDRGKVRLLTRCDKSAQPYLSKVIAQYLLYIL